MRCPLCSSDVLLTEEIVVAELAGLWSQNGIAVAPLFRTDSIDKYKCMKCSLGFYFPFVPGDDAFYGKLAVKWDWYYKHPGKTEYNFTADLLTPGMNIIDVGCGIGEFATHVPLGVEFLGVELSSTSVEIARSLGRNVQQLDIVKSAASLAGKFDVVTCFQVLEHIVEIDPFISALVNMCRSGGRVIIAVPNNDGFVGSSVNNIFNMPPHHVLLWNKASLYYLAQKYELSIDAYVDERLTPVHYRWFFQTIVNRSILKLLGRKPLAVDQSLFGRITQKLAVNISNLLMRIYKNPNRIGHSSIIVLRKK